MYEGHVAQIQTEKLASGRVSRPPSASPEASCNSSICVSLEPIFSLLGLCGNTMDRCSPACHGDLVTGRSPLQSAVHQEKGKTEPRRGNSAHKPKALQSREPRPSFVTWHVLPANGSSLFFPGSYPCVPSSFKWENTKQPILPNERDLGVHVVKKECKEKLKKTEASHAFLNK